MIIDWLKKRINAKIVYYGPAMSGKTTTVKSILRHYKAEEELHSIETSHGRTLFFDFGNLKFKLNNEWELNINIWSATGQDFYYATRGSVLNDADGIIFVADAQQEKLIHNKHSFEELRRALEEGKINRKIPIVVCINKCDMPNRINKEDLIRELALNGVPIYETIATNGYNTIEAFKEMLGLIFKN